MGNCAATESAALKRKQHPIHDDTLMPRSTFGTAGTTGSQVPPPLGPLGYKGGEDPRGAEKQLLEGEMPPLAFDDLHFNKGTEQGLSLSYLATSNGVDWNTAAAFFDTSRTFSDAILHQEQSHSYRRTVGSVAVTFGGSKTPPNNTGSSPWSALRSNIVVSPFWLQQSKSSRIKKGLQQFASTYPIFLEIATPNPMKLGQCLMLRLLARAYPTALIPVSRKKKPSDGKASTKENPQDLVLMQLSNLKDPVHNKTLLDGFSQVYTYTHGWHVREEFLAALFIIEQHCSSDELMALLMEFADKAWRCKAAKQSAVILILERAAAAMVEFCKGMAAKKKKVQEEEEEEARSERKMGARSPGPAGGIYGPTGESCAGSPTDSGAPGRGRKGGAMDFFLLNPDFNVMNSASSGASVMDSAASYSSATSSCFATPPSTRIIVGCDGTVSPGMHPLMREGHSRSNSPHGSASSSCNNCGATPLNHYQYQMLRMQQAERAAAETQKELDLAKALVMAMVECYMDDHKQRALDSAVLEPARFYFAMRREDRSVTFVNGSGAQWYLTALLHALSSSEEAVVGERSNKPWQFPNRVSLEMDAREKGVVPTWVGVPDLDTAWAAMSQHENFGKPWGAIPVLNRQVEKKRQEMPEEVLPFEAHPEVTNATLGDRLDSEPEYREAWQPMFDHFVSFFSRRFFVQKCFETLSGECKPEFSGFRSLCVKLYPAYLQSMAPPAPSAGTFFGDPEELTTFKCPDVTTTARPSVSVHPAAPSSYGDSCAGTPVPQYLHTTTSGGSTAGAGDSSSRLPPPMFLVPQAGGMRTPGSTSFCPSNAFASVQGGTPGSGCLVPPSPGGGSNACSQRSNTSFFAGDPHQPAGNQMMQSSVLYDEDHHEDSVRSSPSPMNFSASVASSSAQRSFGRAPVPSGMIMKSVCDDTDDDDDAESGAPQYPLSSATSNCLLCSSHGGYKTKQENEEEYLAARAKEAEATKAQLAAEAEELEEQFYGFCYKDEYYTELDTENVESFFKWLGITI